MTPHDFVGVVLELPAVDGWSRRLRLPDDVVAALAEPKVRAVVGALDGHAFRRTVHRRGGEVFLAFGKGWLRDHDVALGDPVEVSLRPEGDDDEVALPPELVAAFEAEPAAEHLFELLTAGRQRSHAIHVARAKRPETRERRAARLVEDLLAGEAR